MSGNAQNNSNESSDTASGVAAPVAESTPASDNLASDLIASMSEPSEHAIAQAQAESEAQNANSVNTPDGFNPSLHETDTHGKPILTPTGRFKKISKNAQTKGHSKKSVLGAARTVKEDSERIDPDTISRTNGVGAANLVIALSVMIGGEEWQPRVDSKNGINEKQMLESAFGDYFVATGKQDLPPGWALVACVAMYAAPRFSMPKTQSRISCVKTWAMQKYIAWKMRKRGYSQEQIDKATKVKENET